MFGAIAARKAVEELKAREEREVDYHIDEPVNDTAPNQIGVISLQDYYEKSMKKKSIHSISSEGERSNIMVLDTLLSDSKIAPELNDVTLEIDRDLVDVDSNYEMVSDLFDYQGLRLLDNFGIKTYRNSMYRGQIHEKTQERHGMGVLVCSNGRTYEGEWVLDKRNGQGLEVFANGNHYKGTYLNNRTHGKGAYYWKNGEVYEGEWVQGRKHGFGIWKGTQGESYMGEWKDN